MACNSGRLPAADLAGGRNGELTQVSAPIGADRWRAVGGVRPWRGTARDAENIRF
jgi:hypothetical protein